METTQSKYETAAKLAMFLQEQTGSVCGSWKGTMTAKLQRSIFGAYRFGKRSLRINGATEHLNAVRSLCFGTDFECESYSWSEL